MITAKQTAIRTFMYCNHSPKTNRHHVQVSSVLLSVVHVAVSGMIVFLCNESDKSKIKQKKPSSVCLQPFSSYFHLLSHHPSMALALSPSHSLFLSLSSIFLFTRWSYGVKITGFITMLSVLGLFTFINHDSAHELHVQYQGRRKVWCAGRYRLRTDVP